MASNAYDFKLTVGDAELGLMLAEDENGNKIWNEGVSPLVTAQTRLDPFSYESMPPDIDHPVAFENFRGGCGFNSLSTVNTVTGYNYSRYVDLSHGDRAYLSPLIKNTTFDTDPTKNFKKVKNTSLGLIAITDEEIYLFSIFENEWELKEGPNVGYTYTDIEELDSIVYVAAGGDQYEYSTDGSTWTQYTDDTTIEPKFFAIRGDVLWMVNASGDVRNTTDGQNSGVPWTNSDRVADSAGSHFNAGGIGSTSDTVTGFLEAGDTLWVFKKEGIWTYDGQEDDDFYRETLLYDDNGATPYLWKNGLIYVAYGHRLLEIDPLSGGITPVFPLPISDSVEVKGNITAPTGDGQHLYFFIKNDAGRSYLIKGNPATGEWHTFHYPYIIGDTGFLSPLEIIEDSAYGDVAWDNPDNISEYNDDDTFAESGTQITNLEDPYRFDLKSFPLSSLLSVEDEIIELSFEIKAQVPLVSGVYEDFGVHLIYDNEEAQNVAVSTQWNADSSASKETRTYKGDADYWGVGLDASALRHNNRVGLRYELNEVTPGAAQTIKIFHIAMKLLYRHRGSQVTFNNAEILDGSVLGLDSPILVFTADDQVQYMKLERPGFSPLDDGEYEFEFEIDGEVKGPWVDFGARAFNKFISQGDILTQNATAPSSVTLQYEVDTPSSPTTLVTSADIGTIEGALDSIVEFNTIRYTMVLASDSSRDSPEVLGVTLHSTPNPPRKRVWNPVVKLGSVLNLRGNARDVLSASVVNSVLKQAPTKKCSLTDRDNNVFNVRVLDKNTPTIYEAKRGGQVIDTGVVELTIVEINQTSTSAGNAKYGRDKYGAGRVYA